MSHTKEPWAQFQDAPNAIVAVADEYVSLHTINDDGMAAMFHEEDARRIVACVNACSGIQTDVLEKGRVSPDAFQMEESRADKAERQRDELLSICRNVVERGIGASDVRAMENAIAKAEEKQ